MTVDGSNPMSRQNVTTNQPTNHQPQKLVNSRRHHGRCPHSWNSNMLGRQVGKTIRAAASIFLCGRCWSFSYGVQLQKVSTRTSFGTSEALVRLASLTRNVETSESLGGDTKKWLVIGDGDLSYSSMIAEALAEKNIELVATVLEQEEVHNQVYERSEDNTLQIKSFPMHKVQFGIDGTKLESSFSDIKFDCIEFNFPHWRGKTNAKRNRELVDGFLKSAKEVLKDDGEIRIALCDGQGGFPSESLQEWRQSWMPAMYAAEHNLLLTNLENYEPDYGLSSHRGVDRPFFIGKRPQQYTFQFPSGSSVAEDIQLSCRHELRIMMHSDRLEVCPKTKDEIVQGDAVLELAQDFIPPGIRFEVPARHLLTPYEIDGDNTPLAVFLLNYSGESRPLTRTAADAIRDKVEKAVTTQWGLSVAKAGRLVSRPYPYALLSRLLEEYD